MDLSQLDLARAQFAMTSIYHFFFVPVTIGTSVLVAILHTQWYRTGLPEYRRLTKFFGGFLLLSVAVGVVTGLVQEFQFGMDWSAYSKFVGDVFGAPLAMEGLAAFFLESTFLGVWVFGWKVLPRGVHLASAWLIAGGTAMSAMFIIAANSWMQNPVGYTLDPETGAPVLSSIGDVFGNPVFLPAYLHVIVAALLYASTVMLAVSVWHLRRGNEVPLFHRSAKLAVWVLLVTSILQIQVGGILGKALTDVQPMKIAAMEAQWDTCQPCSFSVLQVGGWTPDDPPTKIIEIPYLLSILATGDPNGKVVGMSELQQQYAQQFPQNGDITYYPDVRLQYIAMRVMAYLGGISMLIALWGVLLLWRRRLDDFHLFHRVAAWGVLLPFFIGTAGWVLTETGRQPWIVQGLMLTKDGLSTSVSAAEVLVSLLVFFLLYAAVGVVALVLMLRHVHGVPEPDEPIDDAAPRARVPELTY